MARSYLLGFAVAAVLAGSAAAGPPSQLDSQGRLAGTHRDVMVVPPGTASTVSPVVYLNRCAGGCTVAGGDSDAANNVSPIATPGSHSIGEFQNSFGQTGPTGTCLADGTTQCMMDVDCGTNGPCDTADSEWAAVLQCMKEVYSPFQVTITDQKPAGLYTEAIIAGNPSDIGQPDGVLGIALLSQNCSPQDNTIAFTFANHHAALDHAVNVCWTASQETAHAFGLEHEFSFPGGIGGGPQLPSGGMGMATDGVSACNDPMTYSVLCGGEKFFRNEAADCGEYASRPCVCGGQQNSHQRLLSVFGAGTSLIPAPTAAITFPAAGATIMNGSAIAGTAGSKRGVATLEIWLNGFKWATQKGAAFGPNGQIDPSMYTIVLPNGIPDSVLDMELKAYDDLGLEGDSTVVTVTKGKAGGCNPAVMNADGTIDTCAKGQTCEAGGKCAWAQPSGMLGDACTYSQFCVSGICQGTAQKQICTQDCIVGASDSCPAGYDCVPTSGTDGICFPPDDSGGCCSVGGGDKAPWVPAGFAVVVFGWIVRRRRR